MRHKFLISVLVGFICSCSSESELTGIGDPILNESTGQKMLLIGNSFFKPYAEVLDDMALNAGYEDHSSTIVIRGGDNGWASSFWNDSAAEENQEIKEALDQGGVEVFGMTSGYDFEGEDPFAGHISWIEYALMNNPDVEIMIAIPQIDFPTDWEERASDNGFETIQELYQEAIDSVFHRTFVDSLRSRFPETNIFTIPTGWSSFELAQMKEDNLLTDEITMSGPSSSSIFVDEKGHQGDIVKVTGGLLWLTSLYGVDLTEDNYVTGFETDLHAIAARIAEEHDSNYRRWRARIL